MKVVGEKVYANYGVTSYVSGNIIKITDDKISIQVNDVVVTTSKSDVYYDIPQKRKEFFIKTSKQFGW